MKWKKKQAVVNVLIRCAAQTVAKLIAVMVFHCTISLDSSRSCHVQKMDLLSRDMSGGSLGEGGQWGHVQLEL